MHEIVGQLGLAWPPHWILVGNLFLSFPTTHNWNHVLNVIMYIVNQINIHSGVQKLPLLKKASITFGKLNTSIEVVQY